MKKKSNLSEMDGSLLPNTEPPVGRTPQNGPAARPATESLSLATHRSLRELWYATIATVITLILAIGMYSLTPDLRSLLQTDDETGLRHPRSFITLPTGGLIRYSPPTGQRSTSGQIGAYTQDLDILRRRFERGQFEMTLIADSADSDYAAMRLALPHLSFRTMQASDAAELHITASTPAARAAVRAYLNFLRERWKIGR